jgi:phage replication O-like protein O
MSYKPFTNVPNTIFDTYLKDLGYAELKVLLIIIRQTYGWKNKHTGTHKHWDWISQQFFVRKTGLSNRAVSTAISKLVYKDLIKVKNKQGRLVYQQKERQRASKLYYSCTLSKSCELRGKKQVKKLHTTIIKHTNMYREESSQGLQKIQFHKQRNSKE